MPPITEQAAGQIESLKSLNLQRYPFDNKGCARQILPILGRQSAEIAGQKPPGGRDSWGFQA
ncbi:MAG TPA: hypothetical protein VFE31_12820 [Opitutaceae bacterium]|nr:hypothetical protein [Opitutaceae bacterium]